MIRPYSLVLILCLSFIPAIAGAANPQPDITAPASGEIDRALSEVFHSDAPGAAVLIMRNDRIFLRKGYGLANLELGTPIDPADVFRICSITKQFTAVAILQLAEAGKLKLDDEITAYVPDYPTAGNKVTLTHLLMNTSGIPSIDELSDWQKVWRDDLTVAQSLDFTRNKPLDFSPGSDWKYSNTGYMLLGVAIEKASGQSYADYIQTHIFVPAGMTHSYYANDQRIIPGRVPGYSRDGKSWVNAPYISMMQTFSAGALLSTVDDLWKWEAALQAGKLVSLPLLAKAYTEGHLPDGRGTHYGFGWQLNRIGSHTTVEHGGGIPGYAGYELRVADAGLYIAILGNTNNPAVSLPTLAARIARLALGEPEPAPVTVPISSLQNFVGVYRVNGNAIFTVTLKNGALFGHLGAGTRPLTPIGPDQFSTPGNEMSLTFVRDSAHRIDRILFRSDGAGPDLIWPRINEPDGQNGKAR